MSSESGTANKSMFVMTGTGAMLTIALLWIVADQLTKALADSYLLYGQARTVFTGFDLLLAYNSGAAFSFLHDSGGWQRWLLTGISLIVSAMVFVWLIKTDQRTHLLQRLSLACILGGAVGNLIDRAWLGYVIDFISVYWGDYRFATFNIADAAISIGAALLILDMLLNRKQAHEHS